MPREDLVAALSMGSAPQQQGIADPRWQRLMQALAFDPAQFGAGGQEKPAPQAQQDIFVHGTPDAGTAFLESLPPGAASMRPYEPTNAERVGNWIYDTFSSLGQPGVGDKMRQAAMEESPLAIAQGAQQTAQALGAEDYGAAAMAGAGTLLSAAPIPVPGAKGAIRKGVKEAAGGLGKLIPAGQHTDEMLSAVQIGDRIFSGETHGEAIDKAVAELGWQHVTEQLDNAPDPESLMGYMEREAGWEQERSGAAPGKGIRLFHGSPHDFAPEPGHPHGRFRWDKIGTGEGAQAYGYGHYGAEAEAVGLEYRDKLTDRPKVLVGGEEISPVTGLGVFQKNDADATVAARLSNWAKSQTITGNSRASSAETVSKVRSDLERGMERATQQNDFDLWSNLNDQMLALKRFEERGIELGYGGKMYEFEVDAEPEHFLDWDKPLSQQSEAVRTAVNAAIPDDDFGRMFRSGGNDPMGSRIVEFMADAHGSGNLTRGDKAKATEVLREAGIPGIRYLDQGSRNLKDTQALEQKIAEYEGFLAQATPENQPIFQSQLDSYRAELERAKNATSNYVIFDDNLINILRKYGMAGMIGTPLGLEMAQRLMQQEQGETAPAL